MIAGMLAMTVRGFTGVRARWQGIEPIGGQRLYFANHTSTFDFLVLWSILPEEMRRRTRPVAASDYWSRGRIRPYFAEKVFRGVLIERKKVTRANNPVDQLVAILKGGESLIIFPEGTRTNEPEVQPFKSGLYHLGKAMPEIDLVPAYITNANRVLPKGEFLPLPLLVTVSFGAPMRVLAGEAREPFLERARRAVAACAEP